MASGLENTKFPIKITNFVNPHLFHFKLDNIMVGQTDVDVENDVAKHANTAQQSYPTGYHPKECEIVSAYIVEWRKWVRAAVDVVLDLDSGPGKQYIIWCLDHGVPIKLGAQHILPLPPALQRLPPTAYLGGLAKCVPIEKRLNYGKVEYEVEDTVRFNDFLNTYAKRLLDEASEIYFKPNQKMDDNHIFGDVQILKHTGHKVDLLRELMKRDGVRIDANDIPFGIENWETLKTPRFKTDQGQLNFRQETFIPLTNPKQNKHHHSVLSVCSNDLDEEEKTVLDWSRNNMALARDMERTIKTQFDSVVKNLDRYMMATRTRPRREPYHMFYSANSLSSVNQSNSNLFSMYGSRATLTEVQSIGGESDVTSMEPKRPTSRFAERLKQAAAAKQAQSTTTTSNGTANKNAQKMVFIPAGFERDILEFHKYNDF